jgi:hypothetical protein
MKAAIAFIATVCAAQSVLPDGESRLIEVRARMGQALKSLPDYLCLETTERLRASHANTKLRLLDTVELEVAHVGDEEMYSWPGRNMFAGADLAKELPAGFVGTGTYASQMMGVLFGHSAQFRFAGPENVGQRATLRWDFTQPKDESSWVVGAGRRSAQVGSSGSIWADAETHLLVRFQAHATQFPARFPIKSSARTVDYALARIGVRDVLLPSVVEDLMEEAGGTLHINRSRFGRCREYSATSQLTFDPRPAQLATTQPTAPLAALPSNLLIRLTLDGYLRSAGAVIGAPVNAHVEYDIRRAGTILVPKKTPVLGVLRQLTKSTGVFVVMIEFSEIVLPGGKVPFRARLSSIDAPMAGLEWLVPGEAGLMRPMHYGTTDALDEAIAREQVKLDPIPGVAVLIIALESFDLIPGTPMTWVTLDDASKR